MKTTKETNTASDVYINRIHVLGRVTSILIILSFLVAGLLICAHFDWFPTFGQYLAAIGPITIMVAAAGIGEFAAYVPKLGPGASYISFITGNIVNMKLPSIMGAMTALDVKEDSDEFHVLSVVAAVTSSLLVAVLLGVVVLFSNQLRPFLEWEGIQPAISNVMPALYAVLISGSLRTQPALCVLTSLALIPVIWFLNPLTSSLAGTFGGMIFAVLFAYLLFKAKQKKDQA